jgi:hypothetical protein
MLNLVDGRRPPPQGVPSILTDSDPLLARLEWRREGSTVSRAEKRSSWKEKIVEKRGLRDGRRDSRDDGCGRILCNIACTQVS